jgi:hypothetical protein
MVRINWHTSLDTAGRPGLPCRTFQSDTPITNTAQNSGGKHFNIVLFALVGVHALVFRSAVYGRPESLDESIAQEARMAAVLSPLLWAGLIVSVRSIHPSMK